MRTSSIAPHGPRRGKRHDLMKIIRERRRTAAVRARFHETCEANLALRRDIAELESEQRDLQKKYEDLRNVTQTNVIRAMLYDGKSRKEVCYMIPDSIFEDLHQFRRFGMIRASDDLIRRFMEKVLERVMRRLVRPDEEVVGKDFYRRMLAEVAEHPELPLREPAFLQTIRGACGILPQAAQCPS